MDTSSNKTLRSADFWQERLSLRYPSEFHKPPTKMERGQLKQLADKVGPENRETMVYTVDNWLEFAEKAISVKGLTVYPTRPKIGFLLAHCDVAVNLMRQALAREKAKAAADQARVELAAMMARKASSAIPEHVPMTPEEKAAAREEWLEFQARYGSDFSRFGEFLDEKKLRGHLSE